MSLKILRNRCAWWSLKTRVGRNRMDLSPQPPSTTPESGRRRAVSRLGSEPHARTRGVSSVCPSVLPHAPSLPPSLPPPTPALLTLNEAHWDPSPEAKPLPSRSWWRGQEGGKRRGEWHSAQGRLSPGNNGPADLQGRPGQGLTAPLTLRLSLRRAGASPLPLGDPGTEQCLPHISPLRAPLHGTEPLPTAPRKQPGLSPAFHSQHKVHPAAPPHASLQRLPCLLAPSFPPPECPSPPSPGQPLLTWPDFR